MSVSSIGASLSWLVLLCVFLCTRAGLARGVLRDVTAPTRYENALVVGDFEGYVHWLDPNDGRFLARERAAKQRIGAPPLVVGENVYVQGDDGTIAAYTVRDDEA